MIFTVDIHHHMLPDFFWRATNEGDHPVGGIAPPPWSRASTLSFLDGALAELAYALDDLRLDGVVLFSNTRGTYLGDPRFTPLFDVTATKLIPRLATLRSQTQPHAS